MLFFLLLCYNSIMDYVNVVIEAFWQYHIAFAQCAAALIAIFIVFRFIKSRLK